MTGPQATSLQVWVDAQLPPALARWLADEFGLSAVHVQDLGMLHAKDHRIFAQARDEARNAFGLVVITKDDDFVTLVERHGSPPQVVWVTVGNIGNADLRRLMLAVWPRVAVALAAGEQLVEVGHDASSSS